MQPKDLDIDCIYLLLTCQPDHHNGPRAQSTSGKLLDLADAGWGDNQHGRAAASAMWPAHFADFPGPVGYH